MLLEMLFYNFGDGNLRRANAWNTFFAHAV